MPDHKRRGFTLIELLVVISIIALLIALLLPALSKARGYARLVQCATQTRGIATATAAYAGDFNGNLPPNYGYTPATGVLNQTDKTVGGYWWYRVGGGLMRGGLLWPKYIANSNVFYCPSTVGFSSTATAQTYRFNWSTAGIGTTSGPIAAMVSYTFPPVRYEVIKTNYGGAWTGIPGQNWTVFNYYQVYSYFTPSYLEQRLDYNRSDTPLSWDLNRALTMHEGKAASIAFVDGSSILFDQVQYLDTTFYHPSFPAYYTRGMDHPSIMTWLRTFRGSRTLP